MKHQSAIAILAGSALCLALGSVHAFSVFLAPLEALHDASRASVSLIYSTALVAITAAVLVGPSVWHRASGAALALTAGALAAMGAGVAAYSPTLWGVWAGYGLLFGAANGLGYGLCLQLAASASPGREGVAMGLVTAAYGLGATLAPAAFAWAIGQGGVGYALIGLTAALIGVSVFASGLLSLISARMPKPPPPQHGSKGGVALLWIGYGAGVAAGLMIFGHAAGILRAEGMEGSAWLAPTLAGAANLLGSALGGVFADRAETRFALAAPPSVGAAGLALAVLGGVQPALVGLTIAGFAYGAVISCYPAVIAKAFGVALGARVYGRVFTAWGAAGLAGPWAAGLLFDATGAYGAVLLIAAGLSAISVLVGVIAAKRL